MKKSSKLPRRQRDIAWLAVSLLEMHGRSNLRHPLERHDDALSALHMALQEIGRLARRDMDADILLLALLSNGIAFARQQAREVRRHLAMECRADGERAGVLLADVLGYEPLSATVAPDGPRWLRLALGIRRTEYDPGTGRFLGDRLTADNPTVLILAGALERLAHRDNPGLRRTLALLEEIYVGADVVGDLLDVERTLDAVGIPDICPETGLSLSVCGRLSLALGHGGPVQVFCSRNGRDDDDRRDEMPEAPGPTGGERLLVGRPRTGVEERDYIHPRQQHGSARMTPWFTADCHFGHAAILWMTGRPFETIEAHDETLIANWNAVVAPGDDIWLVGDFVHRCHPRRAREIFDRLNGRKRLVIGNHDKGATRSLPWVERPEAFADVVYGEQRIVMSHYALRVWPGERRQNTIHLYGHSHGKLPPLRRSLDVGVDVHGYRPISLDEILALMPAAEEPAP